MAVLMQMDLKLVPVSQDGGSSDLSRILNLSKVSMFWCLHSARVMICQHHTSYHG